MSAQTVTDWIYSISLQLWDGIVDGWRTVTGSLGSLATTGFNGIVAAFGGLLGVFSGITDGIAGIFSKLWGGIKSGAQGAFGYLKNALGFGTPDVSASGDGGGEPLDSHDVGGIVRGSPGQPRKIVAHGGERILTLGETGLFDRLMAGIGAMTGFDASSDFAMAPVAMPARAAGGVSLLGGGLTVTPGDRQIYATQDGWKALQRSMQAAGMGVRTQRPRR